MRRRRPRPGAPRCPRPPDAAPSAMAAAPGPTTTSRRCRAGRRAGRPARARSRDVSPSSSISPRTAQVRRRARRVADRAQRLERGVHRVGVGVVGVVDDGDAVRRARGPPSASGVGRAADSALGDGVEVHAALERRGDGREGVADLVRAEAAAATSAPTRRACTRVNAARPARRAGRRRRARRRRRRAPTVTTRAGAARIAATRGSSALRTASPVRPERLHQLALGLRRPPPPAELADVRGADVEHHADRGGAMDVR